MKSKQVKAFGQVVRAIRQNKQISQQELSYLSDLDRTFISHVENGLKQPTLLTIMRLGEALEIAPSAMLLLVEQVLSAAASSTSQE